MMAAPFNILTGIAAPLSMDNVDTDLIIPSREMKTTGKTGLAAGLFAPIRYLDADTRKLNPAFVLNQPDYAQASILLAGANFGCGSSREHAVWALAEWGIRAILAPSFAPIFAGNCVRNGVLTVTLPSEALAKLEGQILTIDLPAQTITYPSGALAFAIDEEAKTMLVEGLDAIALTLKRIDAIGTFLARDQATRPWVYLENQA
jgi:3-isopropylmalate/(R)-2-methylmalate dehydratase small subunit